MTIIEVGIRTPERELMSREYPNPQAPRPSPKPRLSGR